MTPFSPHFSLEELTTTNQQLPNLPNPGELANLQILVYTLLEPIRELWGCPIHINSAYRSPEVNKAVGGSKNSQHVLGQAADIVPISTKLGLKEAYELIWRSQLRFDQVILENRNNSQWIHVSHSGRMPRREALFTANGKDFVYYDPGMVASDGSALA